MDRRCVIKLLKLTWQQIRQLNFFSQMENLVSNGLEGSKTVILTCIRVGCNMSVCSKYTENMVMLTKIVIKRNMEKLLLSSDEFRGWTGERIYLFLPRSIDIRNFQVWTMRKSFFFLRVQKNNFLVIVIIPWNDLKLNRVYNQEYVANMLCRELRAQFCYGVRIYASDSKVSLKTPKKFYFTKIIEKTHCQLLLSTISFFKT